VLAATVAALSAVPLIQRARLSPTDIRALARHTELQRFPPSVPIITQGARGRHLFLIRSGSVDVWHSPCHCYPVSADGTLIPPDDDSTAVAPTPVAADACTPNVAHCAAHAHLVARLGPGSYFGEAALLHAVPRTATVLCGAEPVFCYAIARRVFLLLFGHLEFAVHDNVAVDAATAAALLATPNGGSSGGGGASGASGSQTERAHSGPVNAPSALSLALLAPQSARGPGFGLAPGMSPLLSAAAVPARVAALAVPATAAAATRSLKLSTMRRGSYQYDFASQADAALAAAAAAVAGATGEHDVSSASPLLGATVIAMSPTPLAADTFLAAPIPARLGPGASACPGADAGPDAGASAGENAAASAKRELRRLRIMAMVIKDEQRRLQDVVNAATATAVATGPHTSPYPHADATPAAGPAAGALPGSPLLLGARALTPGSGLSPQQLQLEQHHYLPQAMRRRGSTVEHLMPTIGPAAMAAQVTPHRTRALGSLLSPARAGAADITDTHVTDAHMHAPATAVATPALVPGSRATPRAPTGRADVSLLLSALDGAASAAFPRPGRGGAPLDRMQLLRLVKRMHNVEVRRLDAAGGGGSSVECIAPGQALAFTLAPAVCGAGLAASADLAVPMAADASAAAVALLARCVSVVVSGALSETPTDAAARAAADGGLPQIRELARGAVLGADALTSRVISTSKEQQQPPHWSGGAAYGVAESPCVLWALPAEDVAAAVRDADAAAAADEAAAATASASGETGAPAAPLA
jgi:CRP-like cAMP-binding protein